jgi:hypothetical protein
VAIVPQIFLGGKYGNASIQHGGNPQDTLQYHLKKSGLSIVDRIDLATHYISLDMHEEELSLVLKSRIPKKSRILVVQEPEVVLPANFAKRNLMCFQHIVLVGRVTSEEKTTILWPQFWPNWHPVANSPRISTGAVMVASNHLSFVKGELYSLRRICAHRLVELQVFGRGWNHNSKNRIKIVLINFKDLVTYRKKVSIKSLKFWFKKYKKSVDAPSDKLSIISQFKICLVIENSQEFLSEKLFDSFFAQCIPVYVGPDVNKFGIPESLVVQCKPNLSSVSDGIRRAEDMNYETWLTDLNKWLHSEDTIKRWNFESYVHEISKIVMSISH